MVETSCSHTIRSVGEVTTAATFLLRVWLPDRPGALGAVATRLGAVKGDLLGIEIVERGGGMVVDELLIDLPDPELVDLMLREISEIDDVTIEDCIPTTDPRDVQVDALLAAAAIVGCETLAELDDELCEHLGRVMRCDWIAVIDADGAVLQSKGDPPTESWLSAFAEGARVAAASSASPRAGLVPSPDTGPDTLWLELPACGRSVAIGRSLLPFRGRERDRLDALAAVASQHVRRLESMRQVCVG